MKIKNVRISRALRFDLAPVTALMDGAAATLDPW